MKAELNVLLDAVAEAGSAILEIQRNGFAIQRKANNDILTQADLLANEILKNRLTVAFPTYGWLSEESADDYSRLQCERVWIVDPIDGTKEFALGIPEYAVSVALVENGIPILGAIFNPETTELFHATKDGGAWHNQQRLYCNTSDKQRLSLLASRSEFQRGEWDKFTGNHDVKIVGSIAYKLGLVAAGKADATFSLGNKSEWDIAAGALLVQEAGGKVANQCGEQLIFNQKNILVNGIIASTATIDHNIFTLK